MSDRTHLHLPGGSDVEIRDGSVYREAGREVYDRRNPERTARRLARRLQRIGFEVTLNPVSRTSCAVSNGPPLSAQTCPKVTPGASLVFT